MTVVRTFGRHHRRRRIAGQLVVTTGALAVLAVGELITAGAASASASASDFARLRQCESGGNYASNTGNGYFGAYQFDLQTWHGLGYGGLPSNASPATQDQAAHQLYAQRGWAPWPACSRHLGLTSGPASRSSSARVQHATPPPAASHHASAGSIASHQYQGVLLSARLINETRADVRAWQAQMRDRGWPIMVDGQFGPQSAGVAQAFQRAHGLEVDGVVGPITWRASWTGSGR